MVKNPKSSEVIMYGDQGQPLQQAEIITVDQQGRRKVEKGGVSPSPAQAPSPSPSPPPPPPPAAKPAGPPPESGQAAGKPAVKAAPRVKNPASAKEQSRALAGDAVGSMVDRMKQAAHANGGMLSLQDLEAMQSSFDAQAREMQAQIERTLDSYADAREKMKWDKERVEPFYRLIVKPFAHLFAEKPSRKGVTRRMLPGYFMAIDMLLGPDNVTNYHERCRGIVARLKSDAGDVPFDWDTFYNERDALTVRLDAQVIVASQFSDYDKRSDWFINLVNSNLAQLPDSASEGEQRWSLAEPGFRRMLDAMLSDLRKVLSSEKGRERLVKRHGGDVVSDANKALKRLLTG